MAHEDKVIRSVTAPGDVLCVDLVRTPGGAFAHRAFRRDPEDGRGWHPVAPRSALFAGEQDAWRAACRDHPWLEGADDR